MQLTGRLKEEYARAREEALQRRDAAVETLYARAPALKALDAARRELILQTGLLRAQGEAAALQSAAARLAALDTERAALLASLGESEALYTPPYRCALCRDTGFVGDTYKRPCACLRQRLLDARFQSTNLPARDRFENFREDIYPSEKQRRQACRLRDACLSYAEAFPDNTGKGMVILGTAGLGKTFLLRCTGRRVMERGYSVTNLTASALMRAEMARIHAREAAADYSEADLLILDDLGSEADYGEITVHTLFSILNERQNLRKPTLIATNLSTGQIREIYGMRLHSRIVAPELNALYKLSGEDLRLSGVF